MKRLLTTLCAIGATLLPTAALANPSEAWFRWAGQMAARSGVRIDIRNNCPATRAGGYILSTRTIQLCQGATSNGLAFLAETLAHEAVHAAQHCVGLHTGSNDMVPIGQLLAAHGQGTQLLEMATRTIAIKGHNITGSTRGDSRLLMIEAEAYALEDHPTQAIQLMEAVCRR